MARRAVITGIGVVAPGGIGTESFWRLLVEGRTATRTITQFDASGHRCRVAAECDFDPLALGLTPQQVRRTDRVSQLAMVAAGEALADSGLEIDGALAERTGVALGSAVGGTTTMEREYSVLSEGGRNWVVDPSFAVPHLYDYFLPSSIASEVARTTGALGPASVVSTGCTSGIDSVGYAAELIRDGEADVMVTGATDAPISPITVTCFDVIRATSARNDDPATACRPFDRTRTGLILGEGSAVLILEELEHARRRGATVYAEVSGYAARCNAYHMTGLTAEGREMSEAIDLALADARVDPGAVDYVNAHGSGTKQNDRHETAAVKRSLGQHAYDTPMSGIKSMIGHSLGAIGSLEIAACALSMRHGVVVPTANLHEPDPECDLDYVPNTAREKRLDAVLTVGSGFGGFQSAMVLTSLERTAA
ncbi:act minimal PKS ketosynthase (KS/KS alpha) [Streptomyces sp. Ag82_O1-12]|uniref:beta-ketoacyl-[acyl-carrier-protein] synthase family protein n=1 Tax=Streptomyces TaxID=1883 RepID=UPI000BC8F1E2|nr:MULTISPECIES: beta-ketoacyl-[acyl-carrier-protein] synthase family protein [unclassified Streptomyces]SMQ14624.1 act minimal PKS ketosynthase (KS/KS alpha) [Streptomyces sp. Ag82_O1-12]SOD43651.1 act minimal PKS ketosynthase (KS/KS alpha) [Streptomyces sp. Ag82_G6-1]